MAVPLAFTGQSGRCMRLRLTWSPEVHELARALAAVLWLLASGAIVSAWLLWQQAGQQLGRIEALHERTQAMADEQQTHPGALNLPRPAELSALRERLQTIRQERSSREWTTNDWLGLLARDMPALVQLIAFQHGPDPASVTFTAQADDAPALAGWLLHMEGQRGPIQVSVLRQDSRLQEGMPVVRVDVRLRR